MKKLLSKILEKVKKTPDVSVFRDLYYMCLEAMKTDIPLGVRFLVLLSAECERVISQSNDEKLLKDVPVIY